MGKRTPDLPVAYGATVEGGRHPFHNWTGQWVHVADEPFVLLTVKGEDEKVLFTPCGHCGDGISGSKWWHGNVLGGVCFQCNGSGLGRRVGIIAQAQTIAKRRIADRNRAARKAEEKRQAAAQAAAAWREQNPTLAADLDALRSEILTSEHTGREPYRVHGALYEFAFKATSGLTDKQTAFAATLLDEHRAEQREQAERAAKQRYAAEVGQKVTVTGTVAAHLYIEPQNYGWSASWLVIVEGTGDDTGITVKTFSGAASIRDLERDQAVRITGVVKAHGERDGVPQTELTRPKAEKVDG